MASLTVIKGPDQGRRFDLNDAVPTLGRDAKNSLRLHDSEVSRYHAELRRSPQGFVIYDLKSSNGTFVNSVRVDFGALKTGDRVKLGQTELIFTGDPVSTPAAVDLASRISLAPQKPAADASAILVRVKQSEASQYLRFPERAESQWLKDALANLAIVYETSEAVARISDVDELLSHLLDLVFSTIKADRGCIMLRNPDSGRMEPRAIRFAEGTDNEEKIHISRTIVDWVLKHTEGAIVVDASQDSRFSASHSVVNLGIREAICVPLTGRHDTLGVIYVDTKSTAKDVLTTQKPGQFSEDHLKLMAAIAHQAGLAIEDSRHYQAMMQAERLAAVGQTIATLSHHIKNILQGLRSGSYLVEMGIKDQKLSSIEQGWGVVRKNQEKMYNLVMDMLSYSKDREPALDLCRPNKIVEDVVELMRARADSLDVRLTTQVDPNAGAMALDAEGIHRALLNIVSNALDAVEGKAKGEVHVETSIDAHGRYLAFVVTDNGVGIAEDRLSRIFQVFSSTKGARGTGLGLAVSQKIAREHGGQIRVSSELGKGSRFSLEVPIRRQLATLPAHDPTRTEIDMNSLAAEQHHEG